MRMTVMLGIVLIALIGGLAIGVQGQQAQAPIDYSGEWMAVVHEDQPARVAGPELGEYVGFPINAALRQKAETWDASVLSQPERQTQPHPAPYSLRGGGGPNFVWTKINDPVSEVLLAYSVKGLYGRADRIVWLDGRNHPSDFSEHTWDGYSTGLFEGGNLTITTTHMKIGVIHRNGLATTAYALMTEHVFRHGPNLTITTFVDDPAYLDEPFVRSSDWVWNPTGAIANARGQFEAVDELGDKPLGWVPSWPMGTKHPDFADHFDLPFEVTQGGKETMYPEYQLVIERLKKETAEKKAAAAAAKNPSPARR